MSAYIGIDLGGNAVNVTAFRDGDFLIDEMIEVPSRVKEGPAVCVEQMALGFRKALEAAGLTESDVVAVGMDGPGPASATGVMSSKGATNFGNSAYSSYDLRGALQDALGIQTSYINDGNAAGLYSHWVRFGSSPHRSSISLIIGTGMGGAVVTHGKVAIGKVGFAAELGHTKLPHDWNPVETMACRCNCGYVNDLESVASLTGIELNLLPHYLPRYPGHDFEKLDMNTAAKKARGYAEKGDELALQVFRCQTWAIAAHVEMMINILDMDAVFIGGGGVQSTEEFRQFFLTSIRESIKYRPEQEDLEIAIAPHGDMAGARGAALYAQSFFG